MSDGHAPKFPWIAHAYFSHLLILMLGMGGFLVLHQNFPCMHQTSVQPCCVTFYIPYLPPFLSYRAQVFLQVPLHCQRLQWWVNNENLCNITMDGIPLCLCLQPKVANYLIQMNVCVRQLLSLYFRFYKVIMLESMNVIGEGRMGVYFQMLDCVSSSS